MRSLVPAQLAGRRAHTPPRRAGVWGHYYGANLGDELVTHVVIQALRRRHPRMEVRAFSLDPVDTLMRHGVASWPITARPQRPQGAAHGWRRLVRTLRRRAAGVLAEGPHLWRSYRALRGVDLLVVAGSGQLLDSWRGPWGHPYTLWKWSALARLARVRLVLLSVGAGPIERRASRWFIRRAVHSAAYVSARDQASARVLRDIGVTRAVPVTPDMAYGLPEEELPGRPAHSGPPVVGVNPMAYAGAHYGGRGDAARYRRYVEKLAHLVRALVLEDGSEVVLFSSQVSADPRTIQDVLAAIEARGTLPAGSVIVHPVHDVAGLLRVVAACDQVVAARYHCVLTPLLLGIPTVALAYHPKTVHLMAMAGQGDCCLDIDTFQVGQVLARHRRLRQHQEAVRDALSEAVPPLRAAVDKQFDHVFSTACPLGAGPQKEPVPQ